MGSNPTTSVGVNLHNVLRIFTMTSEIDQIESILEDVDALIGSFLDAGEIENAQALCEEFKEWFLDYDNGKEMNILTLKMV